MYLWSARKFLWIHNRCWIPWTRAFVPIPSSIIQSLQAFLGWNKKKYVWSKISMSRLSCCLLALCRHPMCLLIDWNTNFFALTLCSYMLEEQIYVLQLETRPFNSPPTTSCFSFPRAPLTSPLTHHNDGGTFSSQTWACIVMCSWETFSAVWKDNRSFVELLYPHLVHWPHLLLQVVQS